MTATVWPARRVGDRVLCGHQVHGRYDCQGELARVEWLPLFGPGEPAVELVTLPSGFTQDPPGSKHWRLQTRARQQAREGVRPTGRRRTKAGTMKGPDATAPFVDRGIPGIDWTRLCPHCGCTARVGSVVLDSGER